MGIQKNTFTWPLFFAEGTCNDNPKKDLGVPWPNPKLASLGYMETATCCTGNPWQGKIPNYPWRFQWENPTINGGNFQNCHVFFVPEGMMGMCSSTHEKNCLWTQIWFCSYMKTLEPRSSMRIQLMSRTEFARYLPQFQQWQDNMFGHLANIVELDVFWIRNETQIGPTKRNHDS